MSMMVGQMTLKQMTLMIIEIQAVVEVVLAVLIVEVTYMVAADLIEPILVCRPGCESLYCHLCSTRLGCIDAGYD